MRISCIQLKSGENYIKNCENAIRYIKESIKRKADFILTPEVTTIITKNKNLLNKYSFKMKNDPFLKEIKKICKKNKKWILIGSLAIKDRNFYRNRSVLIGPDGNIKKYYDKMKMFDIKLNNKEIHKESKTYKPGNKLVAAKLPWGNLGLTICYDIRFPEIYRKLSKKKLNFISIPSAFTKITGKKHWLTLLRARAIENFCYIFAPAQGGIHYNGRKTFGHSMIVSPDGKILKELKKNEGVITTIIDAKLPKVLRLKIPSLKGE